MKIVKQKAMHQPWHYRTKECRQKEIFINT